ncbi:hypothetical protein GCM10007079_48560 [Nocardiopsis terrae]|uniref:Uncharacterized protein n=1 Tax=Nocardiopsis terrae TaxID=372655 RepID=A0ABR9HAG7_9ACTN|nr:hypothetical protein [Nocardiopsis terrae]MBE1456027.1 hypothetical protein [Nocardiopsis terrae]GHC96226.1 hypothetical protein GCM10007079_48560 [Nocardiopsis terrae]
MSGGALVFAQEEITIPEYSGPVMLTLLVVVLTAFAIGGSYELHRKIRHEREKLE